MDIKKLLQAINNQDENEIQVQLETVTTESDRFQVALCLLTIIQAIYNDVDLSNTDITSNSPRPTGATSASRLIKKYEILLPLLSKISPDHFNTTATKRMSKLVSISIKAHTLELAKSIPLITPTLLELFSSIFNDSLLQAKEIHDYFIREFNTVVSHRSSPKSIHLTSGESLPPSIKNIQPAVDASDTPPLIAAVAVKMSSTNLSASLATESINHATHPLYGNSASTGIHPFQLFTNISETGQTYWSDLCRNYNTTTKQFLLNVLETIKASIKFPGETILPFIAEMGLIEIFKNVLEDSCENKLAQNDLLLTLTYALKSHYYEIASILFENQICFDFFKSNYSKRFFIDYFKKELSGLSSETALAAFYQRLATWYFPLVASSEIAPFSLQTLLQTIQNNDHLAALKFLDSFTTHEEKQLLAMFIDEYSERDNSLVIILQDKIKTGVTQWEKVVVQLVRLGINLHLAYLEKDRDNTPLILKSVSAKTAKKISRYQQIQATKVSFKPTQVTLSRTNKSSAETDSSIEKVNTIEEDNNNKQPSHMTKFQIAMHKEKSLLKAADYPNKNKVKTNGKWRHCYRTLFLSDTTQKDQNYRELFRIVYQITYPPPAEAIEGEKNSKADKIATDISQSEREVLHGLANNLPNLVATALAAKHSNSLLWTHTIKRAFYRTFQQQHHPFIQIFLENVTFTDNAIFCFNYKEFYNPLYYIEHNNNHHIQYLVLKTMLDIENRGAVIQMSIYYLAAKYRLVNCLTNLLSHHNLDSNGHEHNDFAAFDLVVRQNYSECIYCFLMHNAAFLNYALAKHPKAIFQLFENMFCTIDSVARIEVAYLYMQRLLNIIEENNLVKELDHRRDWQYLLIQLKIKALILVASDLLIDSATPSETSMHIDRGLFHHVLYQMYESKTQIECYLSHQWQFLFAQFMIRSKHKSPLLKDKINIILGQLNRLSSHTQSLRFYNQQSPIDTHMSNAFADLQNIQQALSTKMIGILPLAADLGLIEIIRYLLRHYSIPTARRVTLRLPDKETKSSQQTITKLNNSSPSDTDKRSNNQSSRLTIATEDIDKAFEFAIMHQFIDIIELLCSNESIFLYINDARQLMAVAIMVDSAALISRMINFNSPTVEEVEILLNYAIENKSHRLLQPLVEHKESVTFFSKQKPPLFIEFISSEINCATDLTILYKIHIKLQSTYRKILLSIDKRTLIRSSTHQSLDKVLQLKALQFIGSLAKDIPTQATFLFKILTDSGDNFWNCYPYLLRMIQDASKTDTVLSCYEIIVVLQRLIALPHSGQLQNHAICKQLIIALKEKTLAIMRCALQSNETIDEALLKIFTLKSGISNSWDIKMLIRANTIKKRASLISASNSVTPLSHAIKSLQELQLSVSTKTVSDAVKVHEEKMAKAEQILQLLKQPHSDTQYNSDDLDKVLPILHEYRTTRLVERIDCLRAAHKKSRLPITEVSGHADIPVPALSLSDNLAISKLDNAIEQLYAAVARLSDDERARHCNKIIILLEMGVAANKSSTKKLISLFLYLCDHINKSLLDFLLYIKQLSEYETDEFSFDSSPDDAWFNLYQASLGIPPTKEGPLDAEPRFYQKRYKQIHHDYLLFRTTQQRLNFCVDYQLTHLLKNLLMNCINELSLTHLQSAFHRALKMQTIATIEILLAFFPPFIIFISVDSLGNSLWYYLQSLPENDKKRISQLLLKRLQDCLEQHDTEQRPDDAERRSDKQYHLETHSQSQPLEINNEHFLLSFLVHIKATDLAQQLLNQTSILIYKEDLREAFALAVELREYELVYLILNDNYRSLCIGQKFKREEFNFYLLDELAQLKNSEDVETLRKKFPTYKKLMENGITNITLFKSAWDTYFAKFQERVKALQPVELNRNAARVSQTNNRHFRHP